MKVSAAPFRVFVLIEVVFLLILISYGLIKHFFIRFPPQILLHSRSWRHAIPAVIARVPSYTLDKSLVFCRSTEKDKTTLHTLTLTQYDHFRVPGLPLMYVFYTVGRRLNNWGEPMHSDTGRA